MEIGTPRRRASLVLVTRAGRVLGRLPEIAIDVPWWQEAWPVVDATRAAWGLEIVLVRLLDSELSRPQGGGVTYLAEVEDEEWVGERARAALLPFAAGLDDHPLRLPYARPGGALADVAWAEGVLDAAGIVRGGAPRQVRTWNLSSIWELPLASGGSAWLKVVPPFFAHEAAMLAALAGSPVPRLLGAEGARMLLADVPGEDRYDAPVAELLVLSGMLVGLQAAWADRTGELLAMGLPDWGAPALAGAVADLVARRGGELPAGVRAGLTALVDGLPARFDALAACGLPDTLVHGDAHPGNARGVPGRPETLVLLDWGDCGVGHPLLDLPGFLDRVPADRAGQVRRHWLERWRDAVPGSDPARAAELIEPLALARQALVYQRFVNGIEPVERRYHDADVPETLTRAAVAMRGTA